MRETGFEHRTKFDCTFIMLYTVQLIVNTKRLEIKNYREPNSMLNIQMYSANTVSLIKFRNKICERKGPYSC